MHCHSVIPFPPRFQAALEGAAQAYLPPEDLARDYLTALKNNSLDQFAINVAIPYLVRSLVNRDLLQYAVDIAEPFSWDSDIGPFSYINTLGLVTMSEELQMDIDIKQYDLRYAKIQFAWVSMNRIEVAGSFKVKGSCENRPKVSVGDVIRYVLCLNSADD